VSLIAALCAVGCKTAFPVAIDQAAVPGVIRDSLYQTNNIPGSPSTTAYSGIKWFVYESRGDDWLVASTATEFSTSGSGSGASSSTLMWRVFLWPGSSDGPTEGRALATLTGPLAGPGTRPADFQAKSGPNLLGEDGTDSDSICAGGIAFDKRIVEVIGVIAGDEVSTTPVNGFWFVTHERGTGWSEFRALDQNGKVLYTIH
jgi:hypothetical protein